VRLGLARTYQITSIYPDFTVEDNVAMAVQAASGHAFGIFVDSRRDPALRGPARQYLEQVGLAGRAALLAGSVSHGEQRQLEVAMALACKPRMLLLDEPMAGLGGGEAREMLHLLSTLKGRLTVLLVEHDMRAVFALADRISVLVYGKEIATGLPEEIRNNADVRAAYLGES
jgi:branched-chain amino acid transport system ATP-binding protein